MLIKFKTLKLNNFLSFGYSELDLTSSGYTLVSGINNNKTDLATSNGSGKSSIWEAIAWVLTGKTIRECKDITNIYTSGGSYVEIAFSIDNDEYKILRSKDHIDYKTNLKIYINGEDKSGKGIKDSEKLLAEYLPDLTATLLGSVIILGQGLPQRFSNNSPSGRKDILEKLSKSDFMIEDIKEKLTNRKNILSSRIRSYEDDTLVTDTNLNNVINHISVAQTKLENLNNTDFNVKINELESVLSTLDIEINHIIENLNSHETKLAEINTQYNNMTNEKVTKILELESQYKDQIDDLKTRRINIQADMRILNQQLNNLLSIKDTCPTCGQKLPNVEKPDTSGLEADIEVLQIELNTTSEKLVNIERLYQSDKSDITNSYSIDLANLELERNDLTKLIQNIKSDLNKYQFDRNNAKIELDLQLRYQATRDLEIQELNRELLQLEDNKTKLSEKIVYISNIKEETQKRLDIVNKMYMIAIRDFRGFLLTNIIDFINRKSKDYSLDIFETDKIEFTLEGNNINIFYDNKQYENLSGGEKQKVDLIVQFSIRDMLCKFLNFSSNIIVLDEIFDNLDALGCQKVLNVISKRLSDIDNIYIVTHHSDIDLPIDNEIVIIKNDRGISEIKQ